MELILTININKKIKVGVVFKEASADIVPRWFVKDGRQYRVDQVNYMWDEKKGRGFIKHFAVMAESTCYELTYNTERMVWHLASVDDES